MWPWQAAPGLVGMSAHNQVFAPAVAEAKKLLLDGLLGRVYTIISQDCFILGGPPLGSIPGTVVPSPIQPGSWRASRATMGGGELIDTGYHPSYRLLFLAGGGTDDRGRRAGPLPPRAARGRGHRHGADAVRRRRDRPGADELGDGTSRTAIIRSM